MIRAVSTTVMSAVLFTYEKQRPNVLVCAFQTLIRLMKTLCYVDFGEKVNHVKTILNYIHVVKNICGLMPYYNARG